jgi:CRISPR-associated endonuclease/helicase Cas3
MKPMGHDAMDARYTERLRVLLGLPAGQSPFPWQERLLTEHFAKGVIPEALDIPTGLGKTSVIAIWAAARAAGANVPRRFVYVVDRRAVVDQATTEAIRLKQVIDGAPELKLALGLTRDLPISTLRGQHLDNREWLEDPASPAIVVGTVDMIGSRLLFGGYRCSSKMRPYHSALLGVDALIVLDEAHLVPPFEAMVRGLVDREALQPISSVRAAVPPSRIMALSATGRRSTKPFKLDGADEGHTIVKRRLDAKKHLVIEQGVDRKVLAEALANRAWKMTEGGCLDSRVIVFVDSRDVAQNVSEAIDRLAKGDDVSKVAIQKELLVGGRRVAERAHAAARLAQLGLVAGSGKTAGMPVFLVATSAGEVGIDLDADHAVLDLVEYERMVQRLGRVNRRGEGEAQVCVVPVALDEKTQAALEKDERIRASQEGEGDDEDDEDDEKAAPKKLNEDERGRVERWKRREATARALRCLPRSEAVSSGTAFDASPRALTALRANPEATVWVDQGSTPPPLYPDLSRAVVESWSMTSLKEHAGRPSVRPWLRGWVDEEPQTTVVWRTYLPRRDDADDFFEAAPIETAETLELETMRVVDWLDKRIKQAAKSREVPAAPAERVGTEEPPTMRPPLAFDEVVLYVVDGEQHAQARTLGELNALDKKQRDELFRDVAGETIVVDARLGGLDGDGLLATKSDSATDASAIAPLFFRVLEADVPQTSSSEPGWRVEATFVSRTDADGEPLAWLVIETNLSQQSTTADGRSTGREQSLMEHQSWAECHARRIGQSAGLSAANVELLALAAILHDEGKRTERWQRAFRAPLEKRPLGKTTSRPIQAILAGYRHELGSLFYAEQDPQVAALSAEDRDLVLHLIAAHHGYARPILRTDGFDEAPPSMLQERARTIALRFARLEKRWGPWGLAWWEALLRAADQSASRENDEGGRKRG